jgi:HD-GYP domain-containing protein (c-di-GMP phosphodiesterase class II)
MYAHQLALSLYPRSIREVLLLDSPIEDIFAYNDGEFIVVFQYNQKITKEKIIQLIKSNIINVFVSKQDDYNIRAKLIQSLRNNARSLSVGNSYENISKHFSLMNLNLNNLYNSPLDDEILQLLYQSSNNLVSFLHDNPNIVDVEIYNKVMRDQVHYSRTQPLLATLLLFKFLSSAKIFNKREIENLFLISYFKDIGMCYLSEETLDSKNLTFEDKKAIGMHPQNSFLLLENRVPFSAQALKIISDHNFLNPQISSILNGSSTIPSLNVEYGLESYIIAMFDIFASMTNQRPYRDEKVFSTFQALELMKKLLADKYPHEFKALVHFFKKFFNS